MFSKSDSALLTVLKSLPQVLGIALFAGCGGDGLDRHQISGTVTFKGEKVAYGTIAFEPEASVGTIAPSGFARIENGEFETEIAESPIAGAYKIRIMGYDASKIKKDAAPGEIVDTPELFPAYQTSLVIPPPEGRFDVDVPVNRSSTGKK